MPQLIKKVEGEVFDNPIGEIQYISQITGEIQEEDYISLNGFIAYLQNLIRIETTTTKLIKPVNFGLKNKFNKPMITLEIDY